MPKLKKQTDLVETYSILDLMHKNMGLNVRASDAYDAQTIEQLLELSGDALTAAVLARMSLEASIASSMADQGDNEWKRFLEELADEARTKNLDPVAYLNEYVEGELGAVKQYAASMINLVGPRALNANDKTRKFMNIQVSEMTRNWKTCLVRTRQSAGLFALK